MSTRFDLHEAAARAPTASSRNLLVISLCLGLSILYQVYFFEFNDGELTGGGIQRLLLKAIAALLFLVAIRSYLSISVFSLNLLLKVPLLFIAATILVLAPFLESAYTQALNLLFFLPVLFVDWNRPGGAQLYKLIWAVIVAIVTIQLLLDPVFKLYFEVGWSNGAVIGGMGNPNVFGIYLVAAGLASALLLQGRLKYVSTILFLATILTGSLASALVGFACALMQIVLLLIRSPSKTLLVTGTAIALLSVSTIAIDFISDSSPISHAFNKLLGVGDLLSGGGGGESESISLRKDYTQRGLSMLADSPLALITGHPGGMPMYSGDGMWIAMLVTYGLPITLYFLATNVLVIYRAVRSGSRELLFCGCVVAAVMAFLITNRILDYWPAALIYLLAFSYLTTKGVRRSSRTDVAVGVADRYRPSEGSI